MYFTSCNRAPVAPALYFTSYNRAPVPTGLFFKITNTNENHIGFQYQDGLNILKEEFNDNPNKSCCAGGLHFTNAENIFKFLDYGIYLRKITLPTDNPDFRVIKDSAGDKWRANMIILGERYDLCNVDTFKYLIEQKADIHTDDDIVLQWSARKGYWDIVKFLIAEGCDIHADDDLVLKLSAKNGHLDIVKFLVELGANIHVDNDYALRWSARKGHLDIVKFLVELGASIHAKNDYALRWSTVNGYIDVVKFLVEIGADIHACENYGLSW